MRPVRPGIGRATVLAFARSGAHIAIADLKVDRGGGRVAITQGASFVTGHALAVNGGLVAQ